jgi:FkbM family methyltransferase
MTMTMHTLRKPRLSILQVFGLIAFVELAQNFFISTNKVPAAPAEPSAARTVHQPNPQVIISADSVSSVDFHVRMPSPNRDSHEPVSIPASVNSVVTYIDATHGTPAVMAYRARCADVDWNANHKNLLFMQAGYNDLRDIDVAIDIGACYGDTAVPIAVNSKKVIAFEPNPFSFDVLEFNSLLNPHLHIHPHNYAVGINDGEFLKFTYGGDMCNGGIEGSWKDSSQETSIDVKTINMQSFLHREYGEEIFQRIDYIKIDTEGQDAMILRSLQDMLPLLKDSILIQVEWFDYFDTSRHEGGAGPHDVSSGSAELFKSIADLGLTPFYDINRSIHAPGPENKHYAPDLYLQRADVKRLQRKLQGRSHAS